MGNLLSTTTTASEGPTHSHGFSTLARIRIYAPNSEPIMGEASLPISSLTSFDMLVHYIASLPWMPEGTEIIPHLLGAETRLGRTYGPRVMALLDELWVEDSTDSRVIIEVFTSRIDTYLKDQEGSGDDHQSSSEKSELHHLAKTSAQSGSDSMSSEKMSGEAKLEDEDAQADPLTYMLSQTGPEKTASGLNQPRSEHSLTVQSMEPIERTSPPIAISRKPSPAEIQHNSQTSVQSSQYCGASDSSASHTVHDQLQEAKRKQVQATLNAAMAKTRKHFTPKWSEPGSTPAAAPKPRAKTGDEALRPIAAGTLTSLGRMTTQAATANARGALGRVNMSHRGAIDTVDWPAQQRGLKYSEAVSIEESDGSGGVEVESGRSFA